MYRGGPPLEWGRTAQVMDGILGQAWLTVDPVGPQIYAVVISPLPKV